MKNFLTNLKRHLIPMKFGLKEIYLQELRNIFKKYNVKDVFIFGSRARGDYTAVSDIDIAIKDVLTEKKQAVLADDLRESNIPLPVDIIFYSEISNDKLKQEIDIEGKFAL